MADRVAAMASPSLSFSATKLSSTSDSTTYEAESRGDITTSALYTKFVHLDFTVG